jgi:hypothetical protein
MEKVVYPLWKRPDSDPDTFRSALVERLGPTLAAQPTIHGVRVTAVDSAVAEAAGRRMETLPLVVDAVLSLWVDDAGERASWEPAIAAEVERFTAYVVAEAEPLRNTSHAIAAGERVYGMCQVVFLQQPERLSRAQWLTIWKESHTRVAIDTQSTFGYRQNVVVRPLCEDAPPIDAMVEENFPPEAMASDHAFYATAGDETVLQRHMTAMMESCARFIDFDRITVLPMSEYLIKPLLVAP